MATYRGPPTLTALLEVRAAERPHDTALIAGADCVTYAGLGVMARSLAQKLHELGVRRGDRVAVRLPNHPLWLTLLFACSQLVMVLQARFSRQRPDVEPIAELRRAAFRCLPSHRFRVTDPQSRKVLGHGGKGELEVRAPSQMSGYYGDEAASKPGAAHAALRSFVSRRTQGSMRRSWLRYCAECMARYRVPVRIFPIDAFPFTAGSNAPKVLKSALRTIAQQRLENNSAEIEIRK